MIIPAHYENLLMQHQNTQPNRSYYIPASFRLDDIAENRERSDRFQLLNGEWRFRYYENVHDLTEEFYVPDGVKGVMLDGFAGVRSQEYKIHIGANVSVKKTIHTKSN